MTCTVYAIPTGCAKKFTHPLTFFDNFSETAENFYISPEFVPFNLLIYIVTHYDVIVIDIFIDF